MISRPAPKIGLLINSIDVFNPQAKDTSERTLRDLFAGLKESGAIGSDSLVTGRISGPHEALAAADSFADAGVDLVVIANIAFPNGHVFLTLATHPRLAKIPLAVIAEPEPESDEWATNAWCGVIMNNHVAKQIGRKIVAIPGPFASDDFRAEFDRLLKVAGTIRFLRRDLMVRFGDAPGGFHSATGDQLAFASTFGTRVDTVDMTAVMKVFDSRKANGYLAESSFGQDDVRAAVEQIVGNRRVDVDLAFVEKAATLYHSYRAIIRANGYTSAAFRCWPEQNEDYIGVSACIAMGLLLANGDLASAACESDWPTAVVQTAATLLSGKPAPCLDWVNYTGGSPIIQLGHCGMGICGYMADGCCGGVCESIGVHPVIRQGGGTMGPVHLGQFEYGPKTGVCIMHDPSGKLMVLVFRGESAERHARGLKYSAVDMEVANYKRLNRIVLDYGFPHHLAVALGDISREVEMLCSLLEIDCHNPDVSNQR